jgi:spore germination protein PD
MKYTLINSEFTVKHIEIFAISTSSNFVVGDIHSISLNSAFETPPESVIIGAITPWVPLINPLGPLGGNVV